MVTVLTGDDVPGEGDTGVESPRRAAVSHRGDVSSAAGGVGAGRNAGGRAARGRARAMSKYEPLPPILTIEEAIDAGRVSCRADADVARRRVGDRVQRACGLTGELVIGGQEHFYLETQCAIAWIDESGGVSVHSSTQHPAETQESRRARAGPGAQSGHRRMPAHGRRVRRQGSAGESVGGDRRARRVEDEAARARAPDARARHGAHRQAASVSGALRRGLRARRPPRRPSAWRSTPTAAGASICPSRSCGARCFIATTPTIFLPSSSPGDVCRTHKTSQTAFRGFGGPQGMLVIEEILEQAARRLGLAARRGARAQFLSRGRHYALRPGGEGRGPHRDDLGAAEEHPASSTARRARSTRSIGPTSHRKRGLAITPVKFGISFTATFFNQAGALVLIYRDGSVQVNHGGTEMGQGLYTKIQQIAAESLGLPLASGPRDADAHRQGPEHVGDRGVGRHRSERRGGCGCVPSDARAARPGGRGGCLGAISARCGFRKGACSRRALNPERFRSRSSARRPTGSAFRSSRKAIYRTPEIHFDAAKARGQPVPLLRLWRGGVRSRGRWLHRRLPPAAHRHPAGRRRFDFARRSIAARSKAASSRASAG